jgi:hypothetical protein
MRPQRFSVHCLLILTVVILLSIGLTMVTGAQSQEPKPEVPATPVSQLGTPVPGTAATGVSGSSWQGPNFGVRIHWDPDVWSVEREFIDAEYDGLQLGTPISTVYLEAYDGFGGDAAACFAPVEQGIREREGVSEVVPLSDRPLPVPEEVRGVAGLFGVTAKLPDGTAYRGVEYVECRTVYPGQTVLEITWEAATQAFNEDFANVEELLAAIELPEESLSATPVAPGATPVA